MTHGNTIIALFCFHFGFLVRGLFGYLYTSAVSLATSHESHLQTNEIEPPSGR
ncbi:hypothetical protein PF005_g30338 [Phytophthora fragariae]|uniref:Uncharacterized protein n=1 Tax=Phytophthora fragariae TaxID=53985 RepID=A0A6A3PNC6_9STRA|nr:hypothetical protein PF003_g12611 [Phytophthora fragariae]KAE8917673.1 hypothetical protein PF009_g32007 [Phytophthora fragariae]KAE9060814.1 hypothetical protein PF006_g31559 [Phytophthora fragariae]KAE9159917.1 hypothetical protein PF004_g31355 [Phytophthora fragariae]KAE9163689.1 hypothetical protein PF005_g30338 [Phytophthora fragariae]